MDVWINGHSPALLENSVLLGMIDDSFARRVLNYDKTVYYFLRHVSEFMMKTLPEVLSPTPNQTIAWNHHSKIHRVVLVLPRQRLNASSSWTEAVPIAPWSCSPFSTKFSLRTHFGRKTRDARKEDGWDPASVPRLGAIPGVSAHSTKHVDTRN